MKQLIPIVLALLLPQTTSLANAAFKNGSKRLLMTCDTNARHP